MAPGLADGVRALLAEASPATVPGGILAWRGRSDFPDGVSRTPALSQPQWQGLYFLLQNAALGAGVVPPPPVGAAPAAVLPVAIANFRLAVPHPAIVERVRSGEPHRLPRHLHAAIEERRAFFAAALMHDQWGRHVPVHRGRRVRFVVQERLLLRNPGVPLPDEVEIDTGEGFRRVELDEQVEASFPAGDSAEVAVRCSYEGNHRLTARFTIALAEAENAPPAPDETWRLQVPGGNSGNAWVYRAPGRSAIRHPVILAEGFPGMHPRDYMYELLNQQGLLEAMRAAGYDVIVVGLDQGMDLVQRNAAVLAECIREARRRTDEPLVVGGVSMGGIVSRYALAQMETAGEPHGTRLYMSIDSPHGGTYTSLGVQWFVHELRRFAPALDGFAKLIDSPSNQQLIMYWLHDGQVSASPLRRQLLADLEAVGDWPQQPRRIAVACGRGDGAPSGAVPGAPVLRWRDEPFLAVDLNTLPREGSGPVASGRWFLGDPPPLVAGAGVPWDSAPGAQGDYHGRVAAIAGGFGCGTVDHHFDTTCSVPTVNALALRDHGPFDPVPDPGEGASPFHDYVCSPRNVAHLEIVPEVRDWLLEQLGAPGGEGAGG